MDRLEKSIDDELEWDEKDLNDFDNLQVFDEDSRVNTPKIQLKQKPSQQIVPVLEYNNHGQDYPLDLWYLIAMYIAPEDVGRFALICRKTNLVVNSVSFWIFLFRRYNRIDANRFTRLLRREHLSIVQTYVIKSLYQTYPLFQARFDKTLAIQKDPHFLLSSRCVRMWYSKHSGLRESYHYYFEFRFDNKQHSASARNNVPIQAKSPIFQANNQYIIDKDTYILHLYSSNFVQIGPYMGMILSRMKLNVSRDYRYHRLSMWFNSSKLSSNTSENNKSVVIIDPVLFLRIYTWYNCPVKLD